MFDPSRFKNDLLDASKKNDSAEILSIIKILNENVYENHIDLSRDIMRLVTDFDPMDKETTIDYIFKQLSTEKKEMFSPVNVIQCHFKQKRKLLSGCFS